MNATGRTLMLTVTLLLAGCFGGARIISSFGDFRGPEGYPRVDGPHRGIDVAGMVGTPVLAVADGIITYTGDDGACGTSVVVRHSFGYESVYCHRHDVTRTHGQIARGEVIGHIGTSEAGGLVPDSNTYISASEASMMGNMSIPRSSRTAALSRAKHTRPIVLS